MILKIIHYCWYGNNPKDEQTLEYIEGWKKLLPDYELREWTDADLSKISNRYVEEAYQSKKWAFKIKSFYLAEKKVVSAWFSLKIKIFVKIILFFKSLFKKNILSICQKYFDKKYNNLLYITEEMVIENNER